MCPLPFSSKIHHYQERQSGEPQKLSTTIQSVISNRHTLLFLFLLSFYYSKDNQLGNSQSYHFMNKGSDQISSNLHFLQDAHN